MFKTSRRDRLFFDLLESHARTCREAAQVLHEGLTSMTRLPEMAERIKALEHEGDEITHRLFSESARVFITPLDREDIHGLASSLDDVLDNIDAAAARIILYRITETVP